MLIKNPPFLIWFIALYFFYIIVGKLVHTSEYVAIFHKKIGSSEKIPKKGNEKIPKIRKIGKNRKKILFMLQKNYRSKSYRKLQIKNILFLQFSLECTPKPQNTKNSKI